MGKIYDEEQMKKFEVLNTEAIALLKRIDKNEVYLLDLRR